MNKLNSIHQTWQPMAAIISRQESRTTTTSDGTNLTATTPTTLASTTLSSTLPWEPATFINANAVWHEIILQTRPISDFSLEVNNNNYSTVSYSSDNVTWAGDVVGLNVSLVSTTAQAWTNATGAGGNRSFDPVTVELIRMTATAITLAILILTTVIGNMFVIAAILLERNLQNVANYLILSLAVADLLVACLVMPLGAVYAVNDRWSLGPELCDMWTSSDVLCCTASILHLVAIATDRYWAVTNIDYIHQRTAKRIGIMILFVWLVSFLVCIAPLLGWKDPQWEHRVIYEQQCLVSQDIGYQIFATASSFYLPLFVILILYWRIFQTARKRIRRRQEATKSGTKSMAGKNNRKLLEIRPRQSTGSVIAAASGSGGIAAAVVTIIGRPLPTISEATTTNTAFTTISSNNSQNSSPEKTSFANGLEADLPTVTDCGGAYSGYTAAMQAAAVAAYPQKRSGTGGGGKKDSADSKRERKAAKTLAIITGAFVVCWLPFFVVAVLLPIYEEWPFSDFMVTFFLWLGYFNSTLNPIIYTIFSPEFRHAFNKILCGRRRIGRRRAAAARHLGIRHFQ